MASRKPPLDYYEILGVPKDAAPADISAAYRAETLRIRDIPGSGEQTRRLGLAYRALSNPDRRRDYDAALSGAPAAAAGGEQSAEHNGLQPEAAPPPLDPAPSDDVYYAQEEQDEPAHRRSKWPVLAGLAAALLLLLTALSWSGGLFGDEPKTARGEASDATAERGAASSTVGTTEREDRGGLADALAALLPGDARPVEVAEVTTDATPTPSGSAPAAVGSSTPTELPPTVEAPPPANATATPEESAPSTPPPAPTPEPAPAPPVNRSSGPRLVGGGLLDSDNRGGRYAGTVGVRLAVGTNGRAQGCRVTRSSGNAELDSTTCRLLQERLQFEPARDAGGNPTTSEVESVHVWGRQRRR